MNSGLKIPQGGALDLVSLGALVHRVDPGTIPFRKANQWAVHVSGGEYNVAANLADCFRLRTGIASAMVDYPIGDMIAERVRAMGVQGFYKTFAHNGVNAGKDTVRLVVFYTGVRDLPLAEKVTR